MAGLTDRRRNLCDTPRPLVTGVVAVGDAWAVTVRTVGRGLTMSPQHGLELRDALRQTATGEAVDLVTAFGAATRNGLARVYRQTTACTRHRLAEMDAHAAGRPCRHPDRSRARALALLAQHDADALRAERAAAHLLPGGQEALQAPGVADAVSRLVPEVEQHWPAGPARADLLGALGGSRAAPSTARRLARGSVSAGPRLRHRPRARATPARAALPTAAVPPLCRPAPPSPRASHGGPGRRQPRRRTRGYGRSRPDP